MEASEETNRQSSEEGSSTSETPAASVSVVPAPAPPPANASVAPASPVKKATSTVKKTKPKKDPRRVAAGKRLAEFNRKARDGKRSENNAVAMSPVNDPNKSDKVNPSPASSFSLTQVLSVMSIVVSLAGLYYKREEARSYLKSVFLKQRESTETKPLSPEVARKLAQSPQSQPLSSIKSMD